MEAAFVCCIFCTENYTDVREHKIDRIVFWGFIST